MNDPFDNSPNREELIHQLLDEKFFIGEIVANIIKKYLIPIDDTSIEEIIGLENHYKNIDDEHIEKLKSLCVYIDGDENEIALESVNALEYFKGKISSKTITVKGIVSLNNWSDLDFDTKKAIADAIVNHLVSISKNYSANENCVEMSVYANLQIDPRGIVDNAIYKNVNLKVFLEEALRRIDLKEAEISAILNDENHLACFDSKVKNRNDNHRYEANIGFARKIIEEIFDREKISIKELAMVY